ncbi:hypothetical protein KUL25_10860 [Rhodobacteraceae bacterium N5(2021)]|uniref:Uncharacterized protein n=1 Tax=Gymnodinialimonas phycosphaerae TaxID=2841589 RepID=A0A975TR45_9RHOB|nr:hypothetical protein [Gymnodinialimonas phycosphaerae]MBY4893264.1 hypothetical protein [Gymnodinialimonas phycosphaerae]
MKFSDLTTLSKLAIGLVIAGAIVSFEITNTSTSDGVYTCSYIDYGKVIFGGLAIMIGGLGEVAALRLGDTRIANLIASGGASMAGIFLVLLGLGIVGGSC